jgi:hypothetical protein
VILQQQGLHKMIVLCTGNLIFLISNLCIYIYVLQIHSDKFDEYVLI